MSLEHLAQQERLVGIADQLGVVPLQYSEIRLACAVHLVLAHHVRVLPAHVIHDLIEPFAGGDSSVPLRVRVSSQVTKRDAIDIVFEPIAQ
ncbi:MAG: hypothetical protein JSW66_05675 [Phycisphaerales bacterium]|nr:MAG: hypothetical protein JSW66_05675 [Phycisphaerales bacterium]